MEDGAISHLRPVLYVGRLHVERCVAAYKHVLDKQRLAAVLNLAAIDVIQHILIRHGRPAVLRAFVSKIRGVVFFPVPKERPLRPGPSRAGHDPYGSIASLVEIASEGLYLGGYQEIEKGLAGEFNATCQGAVGQPGSRPKRGRGQEIGTDRESLSS